MNEWDLAIKSLKNNGYAMGIGLTVGIILAVLVMVLQKPVWQAQMVVAPTEQAGMSGISSLMPQITQNPAVQYMIGRLDAGNSSDFERFETLVNSPRMAAHLTEHGAAYLPKTEPRALGKWLEKNIRIRPKGMTPFRVVTLRHNDPDIAVRLLNDIYVETDLLISRDEQTKTSRRITYLKDQLQKTFHPSHKDALIALLKEQEQKAMMVAIDKAFAAEIIDPPSIGIRPVAPDWRLLFPVMALAGLLIGLMVGGLMQALRRA